MAYKLTSGQPESPVTIPVTGPGSAIVGGGANGAAGGGSAGLVRLKARTGTGSGARSAILVLQLAIPTGTGSRGGYTVGGVGGLGLAQPPTTSNTGSSIPASFSMPRSNSISMSMSGAGQHFITVEDFRRLAVQEANKKKQQQNTTREEGLGEEGRKRDRDRDEDAVAGESGKVRIVVSGESGGGSSVSGSSGMGTPTGGTAQVRVLSSSGNGEKVVKFMRQADKEDKRSAGNFRVDYLLYLAIESRLSVARLSTSTSGTSGELGVGVGGVGEKKEGDEETAEMEKAEGLSKTVHAMLEGSRPNRVAALERGGGGGGGSTSSSRMQLTSSGSKLPSALPIPSLSHRESLPKEVQRRLELEGIASFLWTNKFQTTTPIPVQAGGAAADEKSSQAGTDQDQGRGDLPFPLALLSIVTARKGVSGASSGVASSSGALGSGPVSGSGSGSGAGTKSTSMSSSSGSSSSSRSGGQVGIGRSSAKSLLERKFGSSSDGNGKERREDDKGSVQGGHLSYIPMGASPASTSAGGGSSTDPDCPPPHLTAPHVDYRIGKGKEIRTRAREIFARGVVVQQGEAAEGQGAGPGRWCRKHRTKECSNCFVLRPTATATATATATVRSRNASVSGTGSVTTGAASGGAASGGGVVSSSVPGQGLTAPRRFPFPVAIPNPAAAAASAASGEKRPTSSSGKKSAASSGPSSPVSSRRTIRLPSTGSDGMGTSTSANAGPSTATNFSVQFGRRPLVEIIPAFIIFSAELLEDVALAYGEIDFEEGEKGEKMKVDGEDDWMEDILAVEDRSQGVDRHTRIRFPSSLPSSPKRTRSAGRGKPVPTRSPTPQWYSLFASLLIQAALEGYLVDGWKGFDALEILFGLGCGVWDGKGWSGGFDPRFSATSFHQNLGGSGAKGGHGGADGGGDSTMRGEDDESDEEEEEGEGEEEDIERAEQRYRSKLAHAAQVLFGARSAAQADYEFWMRDTTQEFLQVAEPLESHLLTLSDKYPLAGFQRSLIEYVTSAGRMLGKPELATYEDRSQSPSSNSSATGSKVSGPEPSALDNYICRATPDVTLSAGPGAHIPLPPLPVPSTGAETSRSGSRPHRAWE